MRAPSKGDPAQFQHGCPQNRASCKRIHGHRPSAPHNLGGFLALGAGLGSAMIIDEILARVNKDWRRSAAGIVERLKSALEADCLMLGGVNANHIKKLPPGTRLGNNGTA